MRLTEEVKKNLLAISKSTFDHEISCLQDVRSALDETIVEAVEKIFTSKGRVITTGIGKSAIIAQKITATFNSTGTPAIFMHAADAIHGDLGIIQEEDVVIVISKSGDTPEIKAIIPLLKNMGNTIIGMVSHPQSALAQGADIVLHIPISKEADPNNLAPTASTTAQLVMGDALAVALINRRGFTASDFAKYHPGGNLGKQLTYTVSDLCKHNAQPKVQRHDSLQDVIIAISTGMLGATAVLDGTELIGVITDGDLRRMLAKTTQLAGVTAEEIMTKSPRTVSSDEMAIKAFSILRELNITQLLVLQGDTYRGIIHLHDLIKAGFV